MKGTTFFNQHGFQIEHLLKKEVVGFVDSLRAFRQNLREQLQSKQCHYVPAGKHFKTRAFESSAVTNSSLPVFVLTSPGDMSVQF